MSTQAKTKALMAFQAINAAGEMYDFDTAEAARVFAKGWANDTGERTLVITTASKRVVYTIDPSASAKRAAANRKHWRELEARRVETQRQQMALELGEHCDPTEPGPVYTGPRKRGR